MSSIHVDMVLQFIHHLEKIYGNIIAIYNGIM